MTDSPVARPTDHGKKGALQFFETHQCNALCKALDLSGKKRGKKKRAGKKTAVPDPERAPEPG